MTNHHYDVAIAGAGSAGLLCAARLRALLPDLRIVAIEKESGVGGRLRSTNSASRIWSYGLNIVSSKLYSFWDQTLKVDPDARDLGALELEELRTCGIVSAGQLQTISQADLFSKKGARAIAGAAAARDWENVSQLQEALDTGKRKEQAFQSAWSGTHKSPAALALEHMTSCLGIADMWSASTTVLFEKGKRTRETSYVGDWDAALTPLTAGLLNHEQSELMLDAEIIGASLDKENLWTLTTRAGTFTADRLIVAMSPWDALRWLPKNFWPTELLQMAVKCKPISSVVLSEVVTALPDEVELPDRILVPAEGVQILISPNKDICYQATIDFEVSLQAPDVVKAVRRLRRARKKLFQAVVGLETEGDHLALLPVAWAMPTGQNDRRHIEKMAKTSINTDRLLFCGDAYGAKFDGDENFIESLLTVCEELSKPIEARAQTQPADGPREPLEQHDGKDH